MSKTTKAFTLVELIVVIIILAILGTIAFISLQGYSKSSRDSVRISDISRMKTSLEVFQIDAGKYPMPTDGQNIMYSGAIVWNQGIFGEQTYSNVDKLDKIPLDPLTDSNYTYSVTATRNKFQIGGTIEGDPIAFETFEKANAGDLEGTAIVTGTYNGQVAKSLSGTNCNMISVPTIIASDLISTDLVDIVTNEKLVYNGYKNLPSSFRTSKFNADGGFAFNPNQLVAYSDTDSCSDLLSSSNTGTLARATLLKGIQDSYSGTILISEAEISRIVNLTINTSNPSEEVKNLAGSLVNNNLGGSIAITTSSSSSSSSSSTSSGGGGNCVFGTSTFGNCIFGL